MSDGVVARALRYGVDRHDHALLPFMPYGDMTDEDLTAVVSFLRTLPPVAKAVPPASESFLGKVVRGSIDPASPMPWSAFACMTEDDVRAIFRYLKTVPPAPGAATAQNSRSASAR